ncbi:MAG TPA: PepSY-associated TM helix domain-containing protein, partial [Polyangiales bacterium]|nr:PepSY-associated TM helix domain-containing protein [Polyangiales bacterium]
ELYGDENAWLSVTFPRAGFEPQQSVELSAVSGEILHVTTQQAPTQLLDMMLYDLHYALFGGFFVKILYTLFALATCVVIATGNIVWLERRDRRRATRANRILEKLTLGCCLGLVSASACYFAANRLLPASMPVRADMELGVFLGSWLLGVIVSCVQNVGLQTCSVRFSFVSAATFGSVFVFDVITWLVQHVSSVEIVASDLLVLALALCNAALGLYFARSRRSLQSAKG